MEPVINDDNENEQTDTDQDRQTDTDRTDGEDSLTTPSQSRSPSVHPIEDIAMDVFDGYSFKGRHSVILDGDIDEDEADEEDEDEDDSVLEEEDEEEEVPKAAPSARPSLEAAKPDDDMVDIPAEIAEYMANAAAEENAAEPKTPEARPAALPVPVEPKPVVEQKTESTITPRTSHDVGSSESGTVEEGAAAAAAAAALASKAQVKASKPLATALRPQAQLKARGRREKSGIPALDRDLSDANYEDAAEREDDDDWDFVETNVTEEHNGAKPNSLFARGVVDRYKLAVFRKSTPRRSAPRTFSGMSTESDLFSEPSESPTPSEKYRRGRTPGLTFRKHPKQLLRKEVAPTPPSRSASSTTKTLNHSTSLALSASSTVSSAGLLTPSPSGGSTLPISPSLKSKESAISMGSPSESSDQSANEEAKSPAGGDTVKGNSGPSLTSEGEEKQKNKVLKKYKEGAEKVLSIFQSSPNHSR